MQPKVTKRTILLVAVFAVIGAGGLWSSNQGDRLVADERTVTNAPAPSSGFTGSKTSESPKKTAVNSTHSTSLQSIAVPPIGTPSPTVFAQPAAGGGPATRPNLQEVSDAPRKYTWAELESEMEADRQARSQRAGADLDLKVWYVTLAHRNFGHSRDYAEHIERLEKWRNEFPQSSTAILVLGGAYINYAWEARGSGSATTVSADGWELFRTRIAKARELTNDAIRLGVKDGEAYAQLLLIAKADGLPLDQTREILAQGMKADPTYIPMYTSMAQYLLPRWHGNPGDIGRFAKEIVERLPGDDGLAAYGLIAFTIHKYDSLSANTLFRGEYDRELLAKAGVVLVKRYSDDTSITNFAAICAIAAQDHATARRVRPSVKTERDPTLRTWRTHSPQFQQWCNIENPPNDEVNWVWGATYGFGNLGFAPDSHDIWCGQGGIARQAATLIDHERGDIKQVLASPYSFLDNLSFARNRPWVVGSFFAPELQCVAFWDTSEPWETPTVFETKSRCKAVAVHPELPRLVWVEEKQLHAADVSTGEKLFTKDVQHGVRRMAFSPNGKYLLLAGAAAEVWDTTLWERVLDLRQTHEPPLPECWCQEAIDVDNEGRVLAFGILRDGSTDHMLRPIVRLAADAKSHETLIDDPYRHRAVRTDLARLSPNGRWLAVPERSVEPNGPQRIDLWDLETR